MRLEVPFVLYAPQQPPRRLGCRVYAYPKEAAIPHPMATHSITNSLGSMGSDANKPAAGTR